MKKAKQIKKESCFTKEQILNSNRYAFKQDICRTVIPDNFCGTLKEVDALIECFMKGKVN